MKLNGLFENTRDTLIVIAALLVSLTISVAAFLYEKKRNYEFGASQFDEETSVIESSLRTTLDAYAQVLRSGVSLFLATDNVDRQIWQDYIANHKLQRTYPGTQGVSYNPLLYNADELVAFQAEVRRDDMLSYVVKPGGPQELYVPILYLEPDEGANRAALGFDIYSEPKRREAVDFALATNAPSMTSKITLVQDAENLDDSTKAGVMMVLPIFENEIDPSIDRATQASGLIVSVFRIRDFMATLLQVEDPNGPSRRKDVNLYEVTPEGDLLELYLSENIGGHDPLFQSDLTFTMYGKTWAIVTTSTELFEQDTNLNSHFLVLILGVLASLLLTLTVAAQAARSRESRLAAAVLRKGNAQIALLMKEVNHRSKNLLSLVQAMARQTSAGNPANFSDSFGRRLMSLSSSQDLLVRNKWKDIALNELVQSQLGHFHDLLGNRIQIDGPEVKLDASNAQTVSMAIHELATNATKYGALSNDTGSINISWYCEGEAPDKTFHLNWIERGGPPATAPTKNGFGSKVTGMMIEMSLDAEIETNFATEGFSWHLSCPYSQLVATVPLPGVDTTGGSA